MSERTIVEFNHDMARISKGEAEHFAVLLNSAIASGSSESWEPLRYYGITRIVQTHHSDDRKVVTKYAEYPVG